MPRQRVMRRHQRWIQTAPSGPSCRSPSAWRRRPSTVATRSRTTKQTVPAIDRVRRAIWRYENGAWLSRSVVVSADIEESGSDARMERVQVEHGEEVNGSEFA